MDKLNAILSSTEQLFTWNYRLQIVAVLFTLAVTVITIVSAALTNKKDKLDQEASAKADIAISAANERAAQADLKAGDANEKAAQANQAAAAMNEQAKRYQFQAEQSKLEREQLQASNLLLQKAIEKERNARLTLERSIAPRQISASMADILRAPLAALAGIEVGVVHQQSAEPSALATEFVALLTEAGIRPGIKVVMIARKFRGITITSTSRHSQLVHNLANALVKAGLKDINVEYAESEKGINIHIFEKR